MDWQAWKADSSARGRGAGVANSAKWPPKQTLTVMARNGDRGTMATKANHGQLADALLEVLQGAPYRREASGLAEGQISRIRIRAEEIVAGTIERDYLAKACASLKAGIRQRGPEGDRKRQRAREDIEKFRNSIQVSDELRKLQTFATKP